MKSLAAAVAVLAAAGCFNISPEEIRKLTVHGQVAKDLLPADREVGSWRRDSDRRLRGRHFEAAFGKEATERLKHWQLGASIAAEYRLGRTGRTMTVELYDLVSREAAFDLYSLLREKALSAEPPAARLTKVGVQGLLLVEVHPALRPDGRPTSAAVSMSPALVFWADRFLVRLVERGGEIEKSESALMAFGGAFTARLDERPFELDEVYVLQVPGEEVNSERYRPEELLGRPELPGGVTARWKGQSGEGTLFICTLETPRDARKAFRKLQEAAGGLLLPRWRDTEGLFVGNLPDRGAVSVFLRGMAVVGLAGSAGADERETVLEEVRKRCSTEVITPAVKEHQEGARL